MTRANLLDRDVVTDELGVDAALANTPRDQLRVLPTEIQYQDRPLLGRPFGKRQDFSADNSAPLS
jgi:hypothetical protein